MSNLFEAAISKARELADGLEAEGHKFAAKAKEILRDLEGDVPEFEHEAVADAEHVVTDAETEGIKPAETEAVGDAAHLAEEAVHDVETAEATTAPAETETAETPATDAAPASEPTATGTPAASA